MTSRVHTYWLIDKSALARLGASPDADTWASRIERGLVHITTVTRLEVGYSARSASDLRSGLRNPPLSHMPVEYATPSIEEPQPTSAHDDRPPSTAPTHNTPSGSTSGLSRHACQSTRGSTNPPSTNQPSKIHCLT